MTAELLVATGERREQWKCLEEHWRRNLEEACPDNESVASENTESRTDRTDVRTLDELQKNLRDFRIEDRETSVVDQLSPAFANLQPFAKILGIASQYSRIPALVWSGLMFVVDAAHKSQLGPDADKDPKQSQVVPAKVLDLIVEFSGSITALEQEDVRIYELTTVQYTLQDLFVDYISYCTQVSTYLSRPAYKDYLPNLYSRSIQGMLEHVKTRISQHVGMLRNAKLAGMLLLQTRQEAEIARLMPPGISDMPQDKTQRAFESTAQFPVTSVFRARNSAFVGRDDLLEEIANKFGTLHQTQTSNGSKRTSDASSRWQSRSPSQMVTASPAAAEQRDGTGKPVSAAQGNRSAATANSPTICVLHGLGGVGKTQVALEFYYQYRGYYDACFWIEAEKAWTLDSSFCRIADKLGLLSKKTTDDGGHEIASQAVEAGRNWLQTTEKSWLLMFDNVEDYGELRRYLPTESLSNGAIIITTQKPNVPPGVDNARIIQVKALDAETAANCIFRYLDREPIDTDEHDLACQLAEHVGCLPLAMATIGGYVKQSQISLSDFFDSIKGRSTMWEKAPEAETQYERSLITVFEKAFESLKSPTRELLNLLAFLDPDFMPEEILHKAIESKRFQFIHSKSDLVDCYFELRSRQLIRRDTSSSDPYLNIHRVVQWNVLLDLSHNKEKRWECFDQAFKIVQAMLPEISPLQVPEGDIWPPYSRHGRQILELRTHCLWPEPPVALPLSFAQILSDMGTYMWFSGKFPEGKKVLGTAQHILDDNNEKIHHHLYGNVYAMLGIITSFEGVSERKRSMKFRNWAYRSRELAIGEKPKLKRTKEEDIIFWNSHSDMAFGFIQEEDFEKTAEFMEDCYRQYEKWDTDQMNIPFEYSKFYQLISFCRMAQNEKVEAIEAISHCYELMKAAAGNEHPMAQLIKFCHANLLWHTGGDVARQQALEINKAVLAHRKDLLGEFSHFTLESYSTCGKLCHDAGELDQAFAYLESCLQRRKRAVWNEEGITRAQYRYSKVLRSLAERARAKGDDELFREYSKKADKRSREVTDIIRRYRADYEEYLPKGEDATEEENLDQMVSIWAGRYTGRLKQPRLSAFDMIGAIESPDNPAKRRRVAPPEG